MTDDLTATLDELTEVINYRLMRFGPLVHGIVDVDSRMVSNVDAYAEQLSTIIEVDDAVIHDPQIYRYAVSKPPQDNF